MKELSVDFVFALNCMLWWRDEWAAYFESTGDYTARTTEQRLILDADVHKEEGE